MSPSFQPNEATKQARQGTGQRLGASSRPFAYAVRRGLKSSAEGAGVSAVPLTCKGRGGPGRLPVPTAGQGEAQGPSFYPPPAPFPMPSMESPQGKCNQYSGSLRRSRAARRELALGWGAARRCPPKTRDRCDEPEGLLQGPGPGPPRGRQAWPRSVRAGGQQGHQTREVLRAALRSPCQRSLPLALCKESPCPAAAAPLSVPDSE